MCPFSVTNISGRVCEFWRKLKEYLRNLNFFPSVPPSTDRYKIQTQRISTRLFIIIFSISLVILLLYTSLIRVTETVSVEAPTLIEYANLNSTYSPTLTCPCSKVSINYGKFLHVDHTLHQVCSSIFVNQTWIEYLRYSLKGNWFLGDFRWTGIYAFQALRTFCDLIEKTISDRLIQFYSNQYVSASVVPQKLFEPETKSLIDQFRSSLTTNFLLSLSMIRDTTQANALFSALQNNYLLHLGGFNFQASTSPKNYDNCSCVSSFACISQSSIYDFARDISLFDIPNFYKGCYVIESLLQSTLECFYNQQCIDDLQGQISSSSPVSVTVLDESLPSVYFMNSTIKELLDSLMIEQWNVSPIFENYYNECQPIKCTYILDTNNDMIYIFTTLFGIAGGLTTVLRLILPRLIKLIRKKKQQQPQQQMTTGKLKTKTSQ